MYVYYVSPGVLAKLPKNMVHKFSGHVCTGRDLFRGHHAAGRSYTHLCKTVPGEVYGEIDYGFHQGKVCMLKAWIKFDNDPITKHEVFFKDINGDIRVATYLPPTQVAPASTLAPAQTGTNPSMVARQEEPEDNYSLEDFMAEEEETKPTSYDAEQDMDEFMAGITFDVYPEQMHAPLDIDWGSFPMPFF